MEWSGTGIVLSARPHGEGHAVAEILSAEHGRWAGLVYGGAGARKGPLLQPGNSVRTVWRGRSSDALGHHTLELDKAIAAPLMADRLALEALSAACALACICLPDRETHAGVADGLWVLLQNLETPEIWPFLFARWELGLLADLGFGLTLDRCAATGARDDLVFVSPRSACAVSRDAGAPYAEKLLPLPEFLKGPFDAQQARLGDALDGLETTGYFIETRILHLTNQTLPEARTRMIALLQERDETES